MRLFKYEGYDRAAQKVSGELEASSKEDLMVKLRELNIRPVKVSGGTAQGTQTVVKEKKVISGTSILAGLNSGRPKLNQFAAFIRQFSTMQGAGIPVVQALGILSEQVENKKFGEVLSSIQKKIEEGVSLTDALKQYPLVFDNIFINLVAAGELSGSLESVLDRLAMYYEKSSALKRKIMSAASYPTIMLLAVIGVLIVLLTFVVPKFQDMYASLGGTLPAATQMIVDISDWTQDNILFLILGLMGLFVFVVALFKNENLKKAVDPVLLKMPIFGDLVRKAGVARFSRTLSTMIQSGVPIVDALDLTAKVSGNSVIESAIAETKASIKEGNSIAGPLERTKVFPKMVVGMIAVGEETGALDAMLEKVAEFYEDEVDNKIDSVVSIIEPAMILVVGVVVGSILIPLYLPLTQIADLIQ